MLKPVMFIFSGLPGTGKTTLAKKISHRFKAAYLRIDTIEQGIRDLYNIPVTSQGYAMAQKIAADNLINKINVVSDSCNPWPLTRNQFEQTAVSSNAYFINIETICSNKLEHKKRIETRVSDIKNLELPSWKDVVERDYKPFTTKRIQIDTSDKTINKTFEELYSLIMQYVYKNNFHILNQ